MLTGHLAIALGARGVRRDLSLWILVAAAQACDWLELVFGASGARAEAGLWSHAFPFVGIAAAAAAVVIGAWKRSVSAALVVFAVYLSHPIADLVTGYKPLWIGGPNVGLHLITTPLTDFVVQALVCVVGCVIYSRSLRSSRARYWPVLAPLAVLCTFQAAADVFLHLRKVRGMPPATEVEASRPASAASTLGT